VNIHNPGDEFKAFLENQKKVIGDLMKNWVSFKGKARAEWKRSAFSNWTTRGERTMALDR
jgi:hypothetical protein